MAQDDSDSRSNKRRRINNNAMEGTTHPDPKPVLFRHSTASTKKHTRPHMSKLFSSIGLPPEQFLQLQAAAKDYMLDRRYPERRDTVGNREKGDSDLAKLRLWDCVQDFLRSDGNGERFFAANVPSILQGPHTMIWSQDESRIINVLMPLFRRVITNERQRQYALENRKKGLLVDLDSEESADIALEHDIHLRINVDYKIGTLFREFTKGDLFSYDDWKKTRKSSRVDKYYRDSGITNDGFNEIFAIIDHHLQIYHSGTKGASSKCCRPCENSVVDGIVDSYTEVWEKGHWGSPDLELNACDKSINVRLVLHELFQCLKILTGHVPNQTEVVQAISPELTPPRRELIHSTEPCTSPLLLRVTILKDNNNHDTVLVKREILAADIPYRHTLLQRAAENQSGLSLKNAEVQVHLPAGMTLIESDNGWSSALATARQTIWLDHQVNVVIRVR